ncbi:tetratricopeptide repeat protein [Phormidium tenue FACHB-886]|nr:tetratricopeptide repeat protein [Phormidium tenue FACHB-886]
MDNSAIEVLLEDLKNPDETIREQATQSLWQIWFQQKGTYGLEILRKSQMLLEAGQLEEAEILLTDLIEDQPDFAEAWNRRAVLRYLQHSYRSSLSDCQRVVVLNPVHFGALHGMGLCYAALEDYRAAIQAFRRALEIQPYALMNQRLILECTARLS